MEDSARLVYKYEEARPGLRPRLSSDEHCRAVEQGDDVPAQAPKFRIPLTAVGICAKTVWVLLPQGRMGFDAEISVDLASEFRGIHMSRMEEAISQLYDQSFTDLRHYAQALSGLVLEGQEARSCSVELKGRLPQLWRACVSDMVSVDAVEVSASAFAHVSDSGVATDVYAGLGVNHMTACPCTQMYTENIFGKQNGDVPMPTHSQRSNTTLVIQDSRNLVSYHDMLQCLSRALHITQDLLKRPDETEIVLKSHAVPQFAEDVVREVAATFAEMFGAMLDGSSVVRVESVSLESIHSHNVHCKLCTTLDDIKRCL